MVKSNLTCENEKYMNAIISKNNFCALSCNGRGLYLHWRTYHILSIITFAQSSITPLRLKFQNMFNIYPLWIADDFFIKLQAWVSIIFSPYNKRHFLQKILMCNHNSAKSKMHSNCAFIFALITAIIYGIKRDQVLKKALKMFCVFKERNDTTCFWYILCVWVKNYLT